MANIHLHAVPNWHVLLVCGNRVLVAWLWGVSMAAFMEIAVACEAFVLHHVYR